MSPITWVSSANQFIWMWPRIQFVMDYMFIRHNVGIWYMAKRVIINLKFGLYKSETYALNHHWLKLFWIMWCPEFWLSRTLCIIHFCILSYKNAEIFWEKLLQLECFPCHLAVLHFAIATSEWRSQVHAWIICICRICIAQWVNKCKPLLTPDPTLILAWEFMRLSRGSLIYKNSLSLE